MAESGATSRKTTYTQAQRDAFDALVSLKVPKEEAAQLIAKAQGTTSSELLTNAMRLRGGKSQLPAGGPPHPQGAIPVAPAVQAAPSPPQPPPLSQVAPPSPPPQGQPQIPGFGPPGGTQAAPTAEQLARSQFFQQYFGGPEPKLVSLFKRWRSAPPPPTTAVAPTRTAPTPTPSAPAPIPPVVPPPIASTAAPSAAMPAPIKPRVRVKAVGTKLPEAPTPTEVEEAKEKATGTEEVPPKEAKPGGELPLVTTQEEYDKLPIGARFKHPDGYVYRKESESASGETQKLQLGGFVKGPPGPEKTPGSLTAPAVESTDTVPAALTPGEYVVPKPAVDQIGPENLEAMTAAATGQQPMPSPTPNFGGLPTGRVTVGATGQTAEVGGNPVVRGLAYGPKSEGATAADMRQIKGAWGQLLQPGDLAVSPNLQKLYPLRSHVNVVDRNGNIVLANAHVADTSMISEGRPTVNTFEIWNGPSLGSGYHLVPI